ncbi:DUF3140 domain-containing protein [Streptomyces sp. JJ36]|uniref:DUF3140 domain-containing protein n=1 Tax=Streptomyces sp. JJ36 TaxID=2736645 RepID=UPI0027E441E1|nr:DUF3140 domain-containing protein [Streptomyces sp. JJ36]MCF6525370.1 DUF3140 domain-containing protein [Streptomyces sp. JJ36]
MADIDALELDALWDEFHRVVNMTSDELSAWLRTSSAGEEAEEVPEASGDEQGRHVLAVLQKRRTDLDDSDIQLMYDVVDTVNEEREHGRVTGPEETAWRHRLMRLGHDPIRP